MRGKRKSASKMLAFLMAAVTAVGSVATPALANTGSLSLESSSAETQTNASGIQEDEVVLSNTGRVAFSFTGVGGSLTVSVKDEESTEEMPVYSFSKTVYTSDEDQQTHVLDNLTGVDQAAVLTVENPYPLVVEAEIGTALDVDVGLEDMFDVSVYRLTTDTGDGEPVVTDVDLKLLTVPEGLERGYANTVLVGAYDQLVGVEVVQLNPDGSMPESSEAVESTEGTVVDETTVAGEESSEVEESTAGSTSESESSLEESTAAEESTEAVEGSESGEGLVEETTTVGETASSSSESTDVVEDTSSEANESTNPSESSIIPSSQAVEVVESSSVEGTEETSSSESSEAVDPTTAVMEETNTSAVSDLTGAEKEEVDQVLDVVDEYAKKYTQTDYTLTLTLSVVDRNLVPAGATIDEVMNNEDYFLALYANSKSEVALYETGDPDYFEATITELYNSGSSVMDWIFADNNAYGIELKDAVLDPEIGVVRVPKSYFAEGATGIQLQVMLGVLDGYNYNTKTIVNIENVDMPEVEIVSDQEVVTTNTLETTISVPVVTPETADKASVENFAVYLNDSTDPMQLSDSVASYNSTNGILTVTASPMSVQSMGIQLLSDRPYYDDLGSHPVLPENENTIGNVATLTGLSWSELKELVPDTDGGNVNGKTIHFRYTTRYTYDHDGEPYENSIQYLMNIRPYLMGQSYGGSDSILEEMYWSFVNEDWYMSDYYDYGAWDVHVPMQTGQAAYVVWQIDMFGTNGIDGVMRTTDQPGHNFWNRDWDFSVKNAINDGKLGLICVHANNPALGTVGNKDSGNYVNVSDEVLFRVLRINEAEKYAIIGFYGKMGNNQASWGIYKFAVEAKQEFGGLAIQKTTNNSSLTNGNSNYSFSGAKFEVRDIANNNNLVTTLTTDSNGYASTGLTLKPGTYRVTETGSSKGYDVAVSYQDIKVVSGTTQTLTFQQRAHTVTIEVDKNPSDPNLANANANYGLAGAVYGVYTNSNCTGNPVARITIDSNGNGSATGLAHNLYYVKEITAPSGYNLDTKVYTVDLRSSQSGKVVSTETMKKGSLSITKRSDNPTVVAENKNYSVKGAVFGVYTNSACTQLYAKMPATDANGNSSISNLPLDEYWVKEITPPPGHELSTEVQYANLSNGNGTLSKSFTFTNHLPMDPPDVLLYKTDSETGNTPQGNATLEGAEFTVKFYDELMNTDPGASGNTPVRTWVFTAKYDSNLRKYVVRYLDSYKISGPDLYYYSTSAGDQAALPLGTVTIQETKAPNGYLLDSRIQVIQITDNGTTQRPDPVYNEPTIPNNALTIDIVKRQSGTNYPIAGTVFTHVGPNGFTEQGTTDSNGKVSFKGLTHGEHTIYEVDASDGFALNTNRITFTVANDNTITITSKATVTDTDGNITVSVGSDGNIDAVVEDKPAPYDLHVYKVNNKDFALQGAEFTLYSDAACRTVVATASTDSSGNLTFQDLIVGKSYWLKETKAPQGYRIPVNDDGSDIIWEISAESYPTQNIFNFKVNGATYNASSTGSYTVSGTKDFQVCNMTVVNEIGLKLPTTGSGAMIPMIGVGVVLMGGAVVLSGNYSLKRKKTEE